MKQGCFVSKLSSYLDMLVSTHSLFGRGLLEAPPLGFVPGGEQPRAGLVRELDVRLVEGMNDHGGVWRVVNAHINLHWKTDTGARARWSRANLLGTWAGSKLPSDEWCPCDSGSVNTECVCVICVRPMLVSPSSFMLSGFRAME